MLKRILLVLLALLLEAAGAAVASAATTVDILVPAGNRSLDDLAKAMQYSLRQLPDDLEVSIHTPADKRDSARGQLAIAIGDELLDWTFSNANTYPATISFYVSSSRFASLRQRNNRVSALYRDQPLSRQLELARQLIPDLQRAAVIYASATPPFALVGLQRRSGVQINAVSVHAQPEWAKSLSRLMADNDILLGLDDPEIYNRDTIRSILLTTYRNGKVVIGPSRPFVSAGSLASTYTSSEQFLQQLGAMVGVYLQHQRLAPPQYPKFYRIAINSQVATSLGLRPPDEKTLYERMQNRVGECTDDC